MTAKDILAVARAAFASAVLFLAGAVVPIIGGAATIFAPAPLLGYAVGLPRPLARITVVMALSAVLVALGAGLHAAAAYLVVFGVAALMMTYMLERRRPFELIVLSTAAVVLLSGTLLALAFAGSPAAIAQVVRSQLLSGIEHGEKFYRTLGIKAALAHETQVSAVDMVMRLTPAMVAVFGALTVLLNLAIFWRLTGRERRIGYSLFGDLVRWAAPEWLIWGLLASGFGLFIPLAPLETVALNCFICVAAVYFCQGLAIMAFYFKVLAMPPLARGLIYFVTIVQPVLALVVCAAGVFDLWIDFRRLKPRSPEARNLGNFL